MINAISAADIKYYLLFIVYLEVIEKYNPNMHNK